MLTSPDTALHLGQIPVSTSKTFYFTVINNYDYDVQPGVRPGCGSCTIASLEPVKIPAKGTAKLKAVFTPTAKGEQQKTINVSYLPKGGNQTMYITFTFKATVI